MILVLNNKSNLLKEDFIKYLNELKRIKTHHEVVLCPSSIYLSSFNLNNMFLGSQDVSSYNDMEHTGDISASQLKSIGVKYSIVGHSERRKYEYETDNDINKKIKLLLDNDIIPILCVGETREEKEKNIIKEKITKELTKALDGIINKEKIIIAYEPIWAIGSGLTPSINEINQVIEYIKDILPENKILYGGSINLENIEQINRNCNLDGYLVGKLSLIPDKIQRLLEEL